MPITHTSRPATMTPEDDLARDEFRLFFERHHRELARVAYLLLGDADAADDLTADTLVAAWRQWDRVRSADRPLPYVRRILMNKCTSRIRALVRERDKLAELAAQRERPRWSTSGRRSSGCRCASARASSSASPSICPSRRPPGHSAFPWGR
jgi:DNA-directed RNA polymerase specialized sigma24 family protein